MSVYVQLTEGKLTETAQKISSDLYVGGLSGTEKTGGNQLHLDRTERLQSIFMSASSCVSCRRRPSEL